MSDAFHQHQFLTVIDADEAMRRFRAHLDLAPLEAETVPLAAAWRRVLAETIRAPIDIPPFDRSNMDGFAVRAEDTFGASEANRVTLALAPRVIKAGSSAGVVAEAGSAVAVATGGIVPRGASAVVPIEHTETQGGRLMLSRPAAPGANITFAGTDVGRGETVLHTGTLLTSRETGVLAALGLDAVPVVRRPRVAIVSTGDELRLPGEALPVGCIFDSNATVLADAARELGCEPVVFGIVPDDIGCLRDALARAIHDCDAVLLSGGTSKGEHDLSYRAVAEFGPPGIVAHGIALKPGKPLCLAVAGTPSGPIPVVVLPGFPTSALFTFYEFVAPVLRARAGLNPEVSNIATAQVPAQIPSEKGRKEYLLVGLVESMDESKLVAVPLGKGSGSVTSFGRADGFITIPRHCEYIEAGAAVDVRLLAANIRPADLVVMGSNCLGLDELVSRLHRRGFLVKVLSIGSTAGLDAALRGECDLAGIHLFDPATGEYNRPFLDESLELVEGYGRLQGLVFRPGVLRSRVENAAEAARSLVADPHAIMVNRNRGSGTRVLIDELLAGAKPPGYLSEAKSHHAVVAAIAQGRADWGVAIEPVARGMGLGFLPLRDERFDFVVPRSRASRPAVAAFRELLADPAVREGLRNLGFR